MSWTEVLEKFKSKYDLSQSFNQSQRSYFESQITDKFCFQNPTPE